MQQQLIFVYNADSGRWNAYLDMAHKVFSPTTYPCSLCDLTYGVFHIRPEWEAFVQQAPLPFVFLHKDEFRRDYKNLTDDIPLPVVLLQHVGQHPTVLIDRAELDALSTIHALKQLIEDRLSARQAKTPTLTVVGAGPGDPDLITVKGLKALQSADVVLYDALANEALLAHAPAHAEKIYVGKRRGDKPFGQDVIHEMIVEKALQCGHVVRLKGGDPFVFGRGMEEMQYAAEHGLATAYVPGISSAVAGPGLAGIPVTFRELSRGFWVITATGSDGALTPDLAAAARTEATVVVLMGLAKLPEIVAVFQEAGRGDLPVAIVQNASLPHANTVIATVDTILSKQTDIQINTPTLIVIGGVSAMGQSSSKTASKSTEISSTSSVNVPVENIL